MKHLTTVITPQDIYITPRVYEEDVSLVLTDDSTKEVINIDPLDVYVRGNYLVIQAVFNLKEGRFYDFKVLLANGGEIIYRGKIFCSDQVINQSINNYYSVNKDEYKVEGGNNDYIII